MLNWYCLRTRAQQEERARFHLQNQGLEALAPVYKSWQHTKYVDRQVILPLFPRYIFCRADLELSWRPINSTRGVSRFLTDPEGVPIAVGEYVIEEIRSRIGTDGFVWLYGEPDDKDLGLRCGQTVRITAGAYEGHTAIFQRTCSDGERVKLLIEWVNGTHNELTYPRSAISALTLI